jgi:hypothetical protein
VTSGSGGRILLIAAATAVSGAVVAGIVLLGSPATQRQQRLDSLRIDDLARIERSVASFAALHKALPRDLVSLSKEPGYALRINDPESAVPYEYQTLGADSYRLCAIFRTSISTSAAPEMYGQSLGTTWAHGIGRQCFDRHAN